MKMVQYLSIIKDMAAHLNPCFNSKPSYKMRKTEVLIPKKRSIAMSHRFRTI